MNSGKVRSRFALRREAMRKVIGPALVMGIAASFTGFAVFSFSGTGEPAEVSQDVAQANIAPVSRDAAGIGNSEVSTVARSLVPLPWDPIESERELGRYVEPAEVMSARASNLVPLPWDPMEAERELGRYIEPAYSVSRPGEPNFVPLPWDPAEAEIQLGRALGSAASLMTVGEYSRMIHTEMGQDLDGATLVPLPWDPTEAEIQLHPR